MRDEQMPEHRLERFRMRSDVSGVYDRNNHAGMGDTRRVTAVLADDTNDARALFLRELEGDDEVRRNVLREISAADGENKNTVAVVQPRTRQPFGKYGRPTLVIGACRELGNIVSWRIR